MLVNSVTYRMIGDKLLEVEKTPQEQKLYQSIILIHRQQEQSNMLLCSLPFRMFSTTFFFLIFRFCFCSSRALVENCTAEVDHKMF